MVRWSKIFGFFKDIETVFLILLIFFAFSYRLWFAGLAYPDPIFDEDRYLQFANKIMNGELVADCCDKNAGYPMFLAGVLSLNEKDLPSVKFFQVVLDTFSVFILYLMIKNFLGTGQAGFSSILYAINPFTSSYTGLFLPEVISIFGVLILCFFLSIKQYQKKNILWFLAGLLMGLLIFVRIQLSVPLFITIFLLSFFYIQRGQKLKFIYISFLGLFIASSYSLYAYYTEFKKISIVPPYTNNGGQMYIYSMQSDPFPELLLQGQEYNQLFYTVGAEWFGSELSARGDVNKKYQMLYINRLQTAFPDVIKNYVTNIFRIWNRDHLFYYADLWYPKDQKNVLAVSILYLILGALGIGSYLFQKGRKSLSNPLVILSIVVILVSTFLVTLLSNEPRHTLIAFTFLILWAGQGVTQFLESVKLKKIR